MEQLLLQGGNITYQWTGSFISGGASTTTPSINGAGNYTLLVTNTSNMCTASDVTVVTFKFCCSRS
jgi:hypothetical protein